MTNTRYVRTLSPLAQRLTAYHERARDLTEAWCRGMAQGGHEVTPDDYAEVYDVALSRAKEEHRVGDQRRRPRSGRSSKAHMLVTSGVVPALGHPSARCSSVVPGTNGKGSR